MNINSEQILNQLIESFQRFSETAQQTLARLDLGKFNQTQELLQLDPASTANCVFTKQFSTLNLDKWGLAAVTGSGGGPIVQIYSVTPAGIVLLFQTAMTQVTANLLVPTGVTTSQSYYVRAAEPGIMFSMQGTFIAAIANPAGGLSTTNCSIVLLGSTLNRKF